MWVELNIMCLIEQRCLSLYVDLSSDAYAASVWCRTNLMSKARQKNGVLINLVRQVRFRAAVRQVLSNYTTADCAELNA